ncbi:hypothetical protein OEZ85_011426 [Tetradesmus obliquus]|uniref:Uncharacterized protein n=1 Tax=Tetradesmus obliquus TaxID=3088 RepID=A0ABY8TSE3_TETOB|nr:hypothetical protein OEZ85_011426 [Tetradesmus obliquus]
MLVNENTFQAALKSDKEQTRLLIADIKDALNNPEHNQAIQDAVLSCGLIQRLGLPGDAAAAAAATGREGGMRASTTSPRSTITLKADLETEQQSGTLAVGRTSARSMRCSNRSEGDHELKHQVESLLQRTDSILSRSSGQSASIQKSLADAPLQRRRTTANYFAPSVAPRQQQPRRASALQESPASTPGARPLATAGGASPDSDSLPAFGDGAAAGIGGLSGLSPSSAGDAAGVGALGLRNHARRLSQQALSEAGDRFDSRATNTMLDRTEQEQQRGAFDSGISLDRTTLVLGRSASWKVAAGRAAAEGPYANFGPLADLVDSVVADASMAAPGTTAAEGDAAGLLPFGTARTSAAASADEAGGKGHVPHKVALGYMLLPDYIQTAALSRLKASLASLSAAPAQRPTATPGGTQFELLLLALTARLSQWPQLERQADQVFQQMLHTLLDNTFARLAPSRGGSPPPGKAMLRGMPAKAPQPSQHQDQQSAPHGALTSNEQQAGAVKSSPAAAGGVATTEASAESAASTPDAALSPPNMRMPLDGGCVAVYKDGVEVHSTNRLVISVCSSPTFG